MAWLMQILTFLLNLIIPIALKQLSEYFMNSKELHDWKKAEQAKLEAAAKKYKDELKQAGNDEQAQKDAFDKLLNSSR